MPLVQPAAAPLVSDIAETAVAEEYERRGLERYPDEALIQAAASVIGVPRAEIPAERSSFVLHAPLELMARVALLNFVPPDRRRAARLRIVSLAAGYQASGPAVADPADFEFDSPLHAVGVLATAINVGDLDAVDEASAWLGQRARPEQLVALLLPMVLDRLSAAGHGNIYLALSARTAHRQLPGQMLRHPLREIAQGAEHRIRLPRTRMATVAGRPHQLLAALARTAPTGAPPSNFIAPLVEHSQNNGVFTRLLEPDGTFLASPEVPFELLRFAAQAMLQGPAVQAQYGWTHCLTLAQAPLMTAAFTGTSRPEATFVAVAYLAAHWAGHGQGFVDLDHIPERVDVPFTDALATDPSMAAAAAWHHSDLSAVSSELATSASVGHDAHRVKYTLACLDAAATDPASQRLYIAAAAYLNAWWSGREDSTDPLGAAT